MIVIPPSSSQEEYFLDIAKKAWEISREKNDYETMKSEQKTLVVKCKINFNEKDVIVNLHYRFFKEDIYCFVEESETAP